MKVPVRGSLLWRLYAVGVVQLLVVATLAVGIGMVLARLPQHLDVQHLVERVQPLASRPAELTLALEELRAQERVELSLYDADGRLVATNVEPPLRVPMWGGGPHGPPPDGPPPGGPPPPGPPPDGPPPGGPPPVLSLPPFGGPPPGPPHHPESFTAIDVDGRSGLLVARFERPKPSQMPALLTLLSGLIVVGMGTLLTARWIARPLAQVSSAARALGKGNLGARTDLGRTNILGDVGIAFDEMAERVQRLVLAEKELLANVSHELRTPLARIRVALDLAVEGDGEAARASLAEIAVDLAELEALLGDVLHATRLGLDGGEAPEAGFALHREDVAPKAIVAGASDRFVAHHPGRPLDVSVEEDLPEVSVDPVLFRRVIDNLLENAHKYSPDFSSKIRVCARRREDRVDFEVLDRGMGIGAEDLPRVFEPFFRGDKSRSRAGGGVGLGLTLAKRIVEAHEGSIDVKSTLGEGTTVRVSVASVGARAPSGESCLEAGPTLSSRRPPDRLTG
jgi:two-component system, OmpR family, sensor kinase